MNNYPLMSDLQIKTIILPPILKNYLKETNATNVSANRKQVKLSHVVHGIVKTLATL